MCRCVRACAYVGVPTDPLVSVGACEEGRPHTPRCAGEKEPVGGGRGVRFPKGERDAFLLGNGSGNSDAVLILELSTVDRLRTK